MKRNLPVPIAKTPPNVASGDYASPAICGGERWLPILGFEGVYEVNDQGRVRSLDRRLADGHEVRHLDGVRSNNRMSNLQWASHETIIQAAIAIGDFPRGEANGRRKLTEAEVRKARKLHKEGTSLRRLAAQFGVSRPTISSAINGATWAHVSR